MSQKKKSTGKIEKRANQGAGVGLGLGASKGYRKIKKLEKAVGAKAPKSVIRKATASKAVHVGAKGAVIGAGVGLAERERAKRKKK